MSLEKRRFSEFNKKKCRFSEFSQKSTKVLELVARKVVEVNSQPVIVISKRTSTVHIPYRCIKKSFDITRDTCTGEPEKERCSQISEGSCTVEITNHTKSSNEHC